MVLTRKLALSLSGILTVAMCLLALWVVRPAHFPRNPELFSLVIAVAITAGVPLLFYLFAVLTSRLPPGIMCRSD
jgi:hypothetical protein